MPGSPSCWELTDVTFAFRMDGLECTFSIAISSARLAFSVQLGQRQVQTVSCNKHTFQVLAVHLSGSLDNHRFPDRLKREICAVAAVAMREEQACFEAPRLGFIFI